MSTIADVTLQASVEADVNDREGALAFLE